MEAFIRGLAGRRLEAAVRRGKFLWLPLDDGRALSAHLGMSGQLLVRGTGPATSAGGQEPGSVGDAPAADAVVADPSVPRVDLTATRAPSLVRDLSVRLRHLRVRLHLTSREADPHPQAGAALDLVDQRMLGGLRLSEMVATADGASGEKDHRNRSCRRTRRISRETCWTPRWTLTGSWRGCARHGEVSRLC